MSVEAKFRDDDADLSDSVGTDKFLFSWLTIWRLTATLVVVPHRKPTDAAVYIFIQQIYVLNILNMLHTLRFFLFKMPFIS
jgi:hypothetical protein